MNTFTGIPWEDTTCADRNGFQLIFEEAWVYTDGRSAPWCEKCLKPIGHGQEMEWLIQTIMSFMR
jgi:hypothetical protein